MLRGNEPLCTKAMLALQELTLTKFKEEQVASMDAVEEPILTCLGLTDSGIAYLRKLDCAFLTVDVDLYMHLGRIGANVINFNHHRTYLSTSTKPTLKQE